MFIECLLFEVSYKSLMSSPSMVFMSPEPLFGGSSYKTVKGNYKV